MNYTENIRPFKQDSLFNNTSDEREDIIIDSKEVRTGVLYFQSGMPSFVQTGMCSIVVEKKNYGPKNEPRMRDISR